MTTRPHPSSAVTRLRFATEYATVIQEFRALTGMTSPESGRCCLTVKDDVPECCWDLGPALTFTPRELRLLEDLFDVDRRWFDVERSPFGHVARLRPEVWDRIPGWAIDGWTANSLESASHPTRPVIGLHGEPIGVVVTDECSALWAFDRLQDVRDDLLRLWRRAVALTGLKPYYAWYELRKDWRLL